MSPCKKISCLRRIKTSWQNKFFTCLIYICTQPWFPWVSLPLFPKYGIEIMLVSLFRLISMITPALGFHTAGWHNLMVHGFCSFPVMRTAISPSALFKLCHSSITIIATSLILLLAMLLLMLFNRVHVCKVLLLTSCQRGRTGLANSVPEPALNLLAASCILHVLYLNQWFSKWAT